MARAPGHVVQRIAAQGLANPPACQLQCIVVLEPSMADHDAVGSQVYPQLALVDSPVRMASVEPPMSMWPMYVA